MPLSRRQFLAAALAPARPNILLLLADNWPYPHASAYRGGVPTPTFDRIAAEGALFHHAFAPNPSCSPSRSGLLTGQWTHALGPAASLYGPLAPGQPTYLQLLAPAGNPAGPAYPSFDAFLQAKPAAQPFCFWFGSHDPHVPWTPPANARPTQLPLPAHLPDAPPVRLELNAYAGEVQRFDTECAELLALLTQRGELQNALIVITSDNFRRMPRGLANCYDLGVRVPLAIRCPAHFKPATQRYDFVSVYDLAAAGLSSTKRTGMFLERERHANVREGNLSYPVHGVRTSLSLPPQPGTSPLARRRPHLLRGRRRIRRRRRIPHQAPHPRREAPTSLLPGLRKAPHRKALSPPLRPWPGQERRRPTPTPKGPQPPPGRSRKLVPSHRRSRPPRPLGQLPLHRPPPPPTAPRLIDNLAYNR